AGAPTTVATVPAPQTTAAPAIPATPAITAAPNADPKSQIKFAQVQGFCNGGQLQVQGAVANNNAQTYTFSFTITFTNSANQVLGTATGSVAHMPPHSTARFTSSGSSTALHRPRSR